MLTKVCDILGLDPQPWFAAFDRVKEAYLVPEQMGLLVRYCDMAPGLVDAMENDPERELVAQHLLDRYLVPTRRMSENNLFEQATNRYQKMVAFVKEHYYTSH